MSASTFRRDRYGYRSVALGVVLSVLLLTVAGPTVGWHDTGPAAAQAVGPDQAPTSAVALVQDPGGFAHAFYRGQDTSVLARTVRDGVWRSEEHTSELQSLRHLVCRLLLEKKNK